MRIGDSTTKRVGLGTNRLENTEENRTFLRDAVDAGLDFIDTAHLYKNGESERTIGAALSDLGDEVVIATKAGYNGGDADRLRAEAEQSLGSLQAEAIDLLYLHKPDPKIPIGESVSVLAELHREGKVKAIGVSNVSIGEIDQAKGVVEIAAVQNEYSLDERKHDEVVDYCAVEGIPFVPYFPLRGGGKAVEEIASTHGATPSQIKIALLLARSDCMAPIPGTLSLDHLKENLAAADLKLSEEELERLSAAEG